MIILNMVNVKIKNLNKIISIILLIIWCLLIFYFSNQNGNISENSSNFIIDLLNKIFPNIKNINYISFIIRKIAHMFLYFVLYLFSYYVCCSYKIKRKYFCSFLFCLVYAISDEIHQLFIIDRSFRIYDMVIDMIGSGICLIILKIFKKV